MHIKKIRIQGFKCFSEETQEIELDKDMSCFVGNNGTGKTAVLTALQRVFGLTRVDRTITKNDFYLKPNETQNIEDERKLFIEATFTFPNLSEKEDTSVSPFSSYSYTSNSGEMLLRIRLEAIWDKTQFEDDVESKLYYITTPDDIDFNNSSNKIPLSQQDKKKIVFYYIPSFRDSKKILANDLKKLIGILKNYIALESKQQISDDINTTSEDFNKKIQNIEAIKTTTAIIENVWQQTHDNTLKHYQKPEFHVTPAEIEQILKSLILKLSPDESNNPRDIDELSDGQISLLYFTLVITLYQLEQKIQTKDAKGFDGLDYMLPSFTIFGFEEPENHLSPYYISRIFNVLSQETAQETTTAIIATHSTSVIRRLKNVEQIRHFRQEINDDDRATIINRICLPESRTDEDYKYINQAVLNHPELYFAKLVILGEGDSEEIIIPQLAKKMGFDIDPSFVAFVKLGGRHVNHMWRLLDDLKISYVTLLDLDYGRNSGGIDTVKRIASKKGIQLQDENNIITSIRQLETKNVFFSYPLDLDMAMLQAFPEYYKSNGQNSDRETLKKVVLGEKYDESAYENGDSIKLTDEELEAYRYLFKSKSKVASHYSAIAKIIEMDKTEVESQCPPAIKKLIETAHSLIKGE